jgi:hypothetical protein
MAFWTRTPKPIRTEAELKDRENNDNYLIKKIFKFSACFLLIVLAVILLIGCVHQYATDAGIRTMVNGKVWDNLPGIIFAGLAIAGISYTAKRGE